MKAIRQFLIYLVGIFFKVYFRIFGEPKIPKSLSKTLKLYGSSGFSALFNKIRAWDAPYKEIEKLVPKKGIVVDLGCGDGLMGNFLAITSSKRKIIGIELNKKRLKEADKNLKNTRFILGDATNIKIPNANCIMLVHVLHHLNSYSDQENLIKNCLDKLKKGGKLIIAEIIETPYWKYLFTSLVDIIVLPILFENKLIDTNINFRKLNEWKKLFNKYEYKTLYYMIHQNMPFPHLIIVVKK